METAFFNKLRQPFVLGKYRHIIRLLNRSMFWDSELLFFSKSILALEIRRNKDNHYLSEVESLVHQLLTVEELLEGFCGLCVCRMNENIEKKEEALALVKILIDLTYGQNLNMKDDIEQKLIVQFGLHKFQQRKEAFIEASSQFFSAYTFHRNQNQYFFKEFNAKTPVPYVFSSHIENSVLMKLNQITVSNITSKHKKAINQDNSDNQEDSYSKNIDIVKSKYLQLI
mmetsp:Transcript_15167/g.15720  ORF Transcript_15167/g.15720 Transcript_15167/m.15720 type:complete len:227 (-) Transcript_15167:16-696(-)